MEKSGSPSGKLDKGKVSAIMGVVYGFSLAALGIFDAPGNVIAGWAILGAAILSITSIIWHSDKSDDKSSSSS